MTALTTPTNESFSIGESNPQRLQSMSPQRAASIQNRQSNSVVIDFELYSHCQSQESSQYPEEEGQRNRRYKFRIMEQKDGQLSLIVGYREKIELLMNKIIQLNEKVFYFEDYNSKLLGEIDIYKDKQANQILNSEHLKSMIWKKDDTISAQALMIDTLTIKVQELEHNWINAKVFQQKSKEKDIKIRQLNKKVDKIIAINKTLEDQIRVLNDKILELQKQAQVSAYNQIMENRSRLKEAISVTATNKQNLNQEQNYRKGLDEGGHRLSLQNTYQRRYKLNNMASVGNITSPLERKMKSHSNINQIKY